MNTIKLAGFVLFFTIAIVFDFKSLAQKYVTTVPISGTLALSYVNQSESFINQRPFGSGITFTNISIVTYYDPVLSRLRQTGSSISRYPFQIW